MLNTFTQPNVSSAWAKIASLQDGLLELLPNIVIAIAVFAIIYIVGRIIRRLIRGLAEKHNKHKNVTLVLERTASGVAFLVALFVSLSIVIPSLKASDLVNLLGIGGVAFGFAFKDILQNFLSGILILLSEPFRIGDKIQTKDFLGTVEDIQTRATLIRTADGQRVVIPNSLLFTDPVRVITAYRLRRIQVDVVVKFGIDPARLRGDILKTLEGLPGIETDPATSAVLLSIKDGDDHDRMTMRVQWWIGKAQDATLQQDRVLEKVRTVVDHLESGLSQPPFPSTNPG